MHACYDPAEYSKVQHGRRWAEDPRILLCHDKIHRFHSASNEEPVKGFKGVEKQSGLSFRKISWGVILEGVSPGAGRPVRLVDGRGGEGLDWEE